MNQALRHLWNSCLHPNTLRVKGNVFFEQGHSLRGLSLPGHHGEKVVVWHRGLLVTRSEIVSLALILEHNN